MTFQNPLPDCEVLCAPLLCDGDIFGALPIYIVTPAQKGASHFPLVGSGLLYIPVGDLHGQNIIVL